jgi:ClpP class serine protease
VVDMSENLALQGVNVQVFSAGDQKTMGQAERPLTEEECKLIQSDIDAQWLKFKTLVTDNRGKVKEENMQGQLFTGESAVAVNLADKVVLDFPTLLSEITTQITI